MKSIVFYSVLVLFPISLIADVRSLSFEDLEHLDRTLWEAQPVQIRGFLYQMPDETTILAAQPNLKSCCVGTQSKIEKQIIVRGLTSISTLQARTLQGVLKVEHSYNESGGLIYLFVLDEGHLVVSKTNSFVWILFGVILAFSAYIIFLFKRRRFDSLRLHR